MNRPAKFGWQIPIRLHKHIQGLFARIHYVKNPRLTSILNSIAVIFTEPLRNHHQSIDSSSNKINAHFHVLKRTFERLKKFRSLFLSHERSKCRHDTQAGLCSRKVPRVFLSSSCRNIEPLRYTVPTINQKLSTNRTSLEFPFYIQRCILITLFLKRRKGSNAFQ